MKLSDCCGVPAYSNGDSDTEDIGICPECKEHCEYIEDDSDVASIGNDNQQLDPALTGALGIPNCPKCSPNGSVAQSMSRYTGRMVCMTCKNVINPEAQTPGAKKDGLLELMNRIAMQIRFHTISNKTFPDTVDDIEEIIKEYVFNLTRKTK
jgi:hypothetical protein